MERFLNELKTGLILTKKMLPSSEIEISALISENHFIRMAQNKILQPQAENNARITVRVIHDKKIGIAITNTLAENNLEVAARTAYQIALNSPAKEEAGLPQEVHLMHELKKEPEDLFAVGKKFSIIKRWFDIAESSDIQLSGNFETSYQKVIVLNSYGTEIVFGIPRFFISFIAGKNGHSGYGSYLSSYFEPVIIENQLEMAISKSTFAVEQQKVATGHYTVLLEPIALAELIDALSVFSFGARQFLEKRSFVSEAINEKMFDDKVTLYDDAKHEEQLHQPFDFEGVEKKKVVLIDKGVVRGIVFDTETAKLAGTNSTGHALPLPNPHGPIPSHLIFKGGDMDYQQLLSKIKRGILVTRLHYTNVEDQKRGVVTGMTRDGTFLIENGEIVAPLMDLRFTQNVLEALKNVVAVGNDSKLTQPFFAQVVAPSVVIDGFNFTGVKER